MLARTEMTLGFRPRMVIACSDTARTALNSRQFRRQGWEVHLAVSGPEARRLARTLHPQMVLLDVELRGESGWLTCAKLHLEDSDARVALLTDEVTFEQQIFAEVAGAAALIGRDAELPRLIDEVEAGVTAVSA